ncbi:MAG: recombinase family protein [Acidobacteria bacterium]|nr:recombinase family protein [Acidobacteriota bacterium]
MSNSKILSSHLKRQAVIYIRQSSPLQVELNIESQKRQYQLTERAQCLGWPSARCVVIDEDLGISGAQSHNRPGYQRLISMIALREVGLVLGLEVSRLARNSLDWYQLLELAAAFDVLIADEDGLYDPHDFNDRLLLGLKGTMSEVELHQIRNRMMRGRLNKAQRGELELTLPIGLERDPLTHTTRLAVDQGVRHRIHRIFDLFRQLRTIRAVLRHLRAEGLDLPFRRIDRIRGVVVGWRAPSYDAIYAVITNPVYAGVYSYGRRRREINPLTQTVHYRKPERDEWMVLIVEHHPGYISQDEFEENQRILANNRNLFPANQGAVRRGHCGRKMRVRYHQSAAYYTCDSAHQHYDAPICNRASAQRVDALVAELVLNVINAGTLQTSLAFDQSLREEAAEIEQGWREKLQRLEYQADLAHRRYEMVDPANRLVAQTLETEWNQRLIEIEEAGKEYEVRRLKQRPLSSTLAEMQQVVEHLRDYWHHGVLTQEDKKELVRCVVERVFLQRHGKVMRAQVSWYGGAISELDVPKYLFSTPHLYYRIRELARTQTDLEIAATLNVEGLRTAKSRLWNQRRVMDFRLSNAIPSGFTKDTELRIPANGYLTSAEAGCQLGVGQSAIQRWYKLGLLSGKHDGGQSLLWIYWNEEVEYRLSGKATPDARMVSVRRLCRQQEKCWEDVVAQAQAEGHQIYRLRRGSKLRFYILPAKPLEVSGEPVAQHL